MFYEENQISSIFRCQNCNLKLDAPVTLPCGITICSKCVLKIETNRDDEKIKSYKCFMCSSVHQMPYEGFKPCNLIAQLLSIKPIQLENNAFSLGLTNKDIKNALELWT